jgi:hypothetical protein
MGRQLVGRDLTIELGVYRNIGCFTQDVERRFDCRLRNKNFRPHQVAPCWSEKTWHRAAIA